MKKVWIVVIVAVVIGLIGGGVWYFINQKNEKSSNSTNLTDNWQTYTNNELGISFKYPSSWGEIKYNNGDGDTGKYFTIGYSANSRLIIGGITQNFSAGRSGFITDFPGFDSKDKYFSFFQTSSCDSFYSEEQSNLISCKEIKIDNKLALDYYIVYNYSFEPETEYNPVLYRIIDLELNKNAKDFRGFRLAIELDSSRNPIRQFDSINLPEKKLSNRQAVINNYENIVNNIDNQSKGEDLFKYNDEITTMVSNINIQ